MTPGPLWALLTPPPESLPYCKEERRRRSSARGAKWLLSPFIPRWLPGNLPPRTPLARPRPAPCACAPAVLREYARTFYVFGVGAGPARAPPLAPLPPSAPPPPRAAAAAAGAQSSSRPATPPPPPQPRPARSRGSRVGAESAPGGEYADPSLAPLTWITGSHYHPKEGKKNNPDSAARPLPSTSCGTQRCPGPAEPNGGTLCPQTPTVPGQM